jgi:hypothetical protein
MMKQILSGNLWEYAEPTVIHVCCVIVALQGEVYFGAGLEQTVCRMGPSISSLVGR